MVLDRQTAKFSSWEKREKIQFVYNELSRHIYLLIEWISRSARKKNKSWLEMLLWRVNVLKSSAKIDWNDTKEVFCLRFHWIHLMICSAMENNVGKCRITMSGTFACIEKTANNAIKCFKVVYTEKINWVHRKKMSKTRIEIPVLCALRKVNDIALK